MATKKTKKKHAKKTTTKKQRQHAKAVAAADQQNARLRDERKAAKDGLTASERAMATAGAKKTAPPKKNGAKRRSLLDAAFTVLTSAADPLNCGEMIERIQAAKLWTGDGKTPQNTLYSAILREIQTKGKEARFVKTARGCFTRRKGAA